MYSDILSNNESVTNDLNSDDLIDKYNHCIRTLNVTCNFS